MKRFLTIFIAVILLLLAAFVLLRGYLLEQAILKIQQKVSDKYNAALIIEQAVFEDLTRISLTNVALIPSGGDTLYYCSNTAVSISLFRLLKGLPPFNNIVATSGYIRLREYADSTDNFSFLLKSNVSASDSIETSNTQINYKNVAGQLWNRFFAIADLNFSVNNFDISWHTPVYKEDLKVNEFTLNKSALNFSATENNSEPAIGWKANGIVDGSDEIIRLEGTTLTGSGSEIPFFKKITGIRFFIQNFGISVARDNNIEDDLGLNVFAAAVSPGIHHWRISPEEVVLDSLRARLNLVISEREIKSGPETAFFINQLPVVTDFSFSKKDSTVIALKIGIADIPAQNFFNSLPKGLFATLEGIKVKGQLSYGLNFHVNLDNPDSLVFDSELKKTNFRIIKYGTENFAAINATFLHSVREKDVIVRNILVGPENPKFVSFQMINPLLINSVLTAEDGTYRFHRGFNEESFRKSIATNIKEKRFARGGSTITMQLVKNVFLHRNKTISRKIEEALIVWLIENNNLVSKERMLEVYLNIIEWGPGIYGIGEAAEFYFAKHPAQLSLEESIYLSSIIPRPKTFRYTFDKEGKMKDYLKGYFDLVAGRLLKKEIISQQDHDSLHYHVELKGPALQLVLPDSIPADSLFIEETEELF